MINISIYCNVWDSDPSVAGFRMIMGKKSNGHAELVSASPKMCRDLTQAARLIELLPDCIGTGLQLFKMTTAIAVEFIIASNEIRGKRRKKTSQLRMQLNFGMLNC